MSEYYPEDEIAALRLSLKQMDEENRKLKEAVRWALGYDDNLERICLEELDAADINSTDADKAHAQLLLKVLEDE